MHACTHHHTAHDESFNESKLLFFILMFSKIRPTLLRVRAGVSERAEEQAHGTGAKLTAWVGKCVYDELHSNIEGSCTPLGRCKTKWEDC